MIFFRIILYFSLLITSAIALLTRPYLLVQVRLGDLHPWWLLCGPVLFAVFFAIYIIDEFYKSNASTTKSKVPFLSLIFGFTILLFLLPSTFREYRTRKTPKITSPAFLEDLLSSKDARVRSLVMLSSSCISHDNEHWTTWLESGLLDKDPMVQDAAKFALEKRIGIHFPSDASIEDVRNMLKNWNASFGAEKKSSK
jgi:hypothetical protein